MGTPGPEPSVTLADTLAVFSESERSHAPLTASEAAERLGCARRTAHRKLEQLAERGDLATKKVGAHSRVWWRPVDAEAASSDGDEQSKRVQFDEFVREVDDYAIFTLDAGGHVTSWNRGAERIKGYAESEVRGEHFSAFYTDDDVEAGVPARNLAAAEREGRVEDEGWRVREDGTEFWANVVITAVRDDDGDLRGFTKVTRDMTDRKHAEQEHRLQHAVSRSIIRADSVREGLGDVIGDVCEVTDWEFGEAWFPTEECIERSSTTWTGSDGLEPFAEATAAATVARGEGLVGRVWESGESEWVTDVSATDDEFRRTLPTPGAELDAAVCVPVVTDDADEVTAVLLFAATETRTVTERLVEAVESVAVELRGLVSRKRTESALRRERDFVERIFEAVPLSVLVFDRDGEVERMNERARDRLGFDTAEAASVGARDLYDEDGELVPPEERPYVQTFETGEPVSGWVGQVDLPDERVWISMNVVPLGEETPPERVIAVASDITKVREQARRLGRRRDELEAELDEVFERVTDGFCALDEEFRFTYVNDHAATLLQRSEAELLGERFGTAFPDVADGEVRERFGEAMDAGDPVSFEHYFESLGFWAEVNAYPSETGLSVYFRDVSDRIERERELERYETVFETVQDGVYTVDNDGRFTMVNEAYAELTGYSRAALIGKHVSSVVDEETVETASDLEGELVRGEREAAKVQADVRTADDERVPAEATFALLPDDGDRFERVGVVRDVSQRERYEERLRTLNDTAREFLRSESEAEINQTIVEAARDVLEVPGVGVYRHDPETDDLYPAVASTDEEFLDQALPRVPADDSTLTGYVFTEGETRLYDDIHKSPYSRADPEQIDMRSGIFVPMGDHGVLICGSREAGAFDESRRRLIELLGASAEAAFDRLEHERGLAEYKRIVETVRDGVYVLDDEDRFRRVNDAFESMTRYDRGDLIGSHASMVFGEKFETLDERGRRTTEGEAESIPEFEEEIHTAADETITVESRFTRFAVEGRLGRVGVVRDVTDRKEYERELETRAHQQEVVSELGRHALENTDLDDLFERTVRLVSAALDTEYCKVLDLDDRGMELRLREGVGWDEELVGSASVSAVEAESQTSYTLEAEEPVVVDDLANETRFSGPDLLTSHGVESGISTIIGSRDDPWGILGVHDTEQRSFTEEDVAFVGAVSNVLAEAIQRDRYRSELEELVTELEESNERLEQFAYIASHDLQEPLRMISNYLQLLEKRYGDDLDGDATDFIDFAVDGAERMRDMIDDLLAYSRVGTESDPFEPTDCEAVLETVLRNLQVQIDESDAEIELGSLPTVVADRNQLEQLFQNLVSNAIKYSGEGPPEVEIECEERAGEWVFSVADDGIGMDPDLQEGIFEVFQRLHTHEEYDGTGVGLALCRKIAERHDGDIRVESEPGEGSTFYVTLPKRGGAR